MRLSVLVALFLASGAAHASPETVGNWRLRDVAGLTVGGATISSVGFATTDWHKATVPGTVLTSFVNDGIFPEPLYGENNRNIPDSLCRTSYWYRAEFRAPRLAPGHHTWLHFEGINYFAEVWINGRKAGEIHGAFTRGDFDVTADLTSGREAAIAVLITPPPHPSVPHEHTLALGTGRNGGAMGADGPTFLATVGWDWIPAIRDRDIGIWQQVTVETTGPVLVKDPYVVTSLPLPRTDSADLVVSATVKSVSRRTQTGVLRGRVAGTSLSFETPISLRAGESKDVKLPPLHFDHPKLWWPNTYGPQNRYRLRIEFVQGRTVSDSKQTSFGVRTITYFAAGSKNLTVTVNGVPIMCRGGNWGMDDAMKRIPRTRLDALLRLHHDANLTMIRNWIGMATEEDFYDLCDKYGILVWDDFWLANPVDGPNPLDSDLFLANAREKILRYRNHPSIAVWCGRNEGFPPPAIDRGLAQLVASLDGQRFYQQHSSSTNGVGGGGPYAYRKPADYFRFADAFHTEIGGPSIPTLEAIEAMMPKKDWWPINDDWAEHDFLRGAQRGDAYPAMLAARFGPITGLPDFVRKAQLANYESYRGIFEGRNSKLFNPATGVLLWMSNPAQPSFVWQLYSYDLEPTSAFFGAQKACEPVHIELDQGTNQVYVVNTTPKELAGLTLTTTVDNLDGTRASKSTMPVNSPASAAVVAASLPRRGASDSSVYFVELRLADAKRVVSENFYWCAQSGPDNGYMPADFTALQTLPMIPLRVTATARGHQTVVVAVTVTNPTKQVALMAHFQLRRASGARVLPAYASDNYISLLPRETRTFTIEAPRSELAGEAPVVAVDGWNVEVGPPGEKVHGIRVIDNDAAIVRKYQPAPAPPPSPSGSVRSLCAAPLGADSGWLSDDAFVDGGFVRGQGTPIDLSGAGAKAAPAVVYATPRAGDVTYTIPIPPLPRGRYYTVRLHFAELGVGRAGARLFNVEINGNRVLTNFDVFSEAGGRAKALVKDFAQIRPDAQGNITIGIRRGSAGFPFIDGVQILSPSKGA
ncbi:MAG: glycosyl hydrolase 2 galactose-binding domain-containing protein [Fimbriimonadaceae bacterium]